MLYRVVSFPDNVYHLSCRVKTIVLPPTFYIVLSQVSFNNRQHFLKQLIAYLCDMDYFTNISFPHRLQVIGFINNLLSLHVLPESIRHVCRSSAQGNIADILQKLFYAPQTLDPGLFISTEKIRSGLTSHSIMICMHWRPTKGITAVQRRRYRLLAQPLQNADAQRRETSRPNPHGLRVLPEPDLDDDSR